MPGVSCLEEGMAWVKGESLGSSGTRGRPAGMEAEVRGEAQWAVRTLEWVLGGELKQNQCMSWGPLVSSATRS